MSNMSYCRFRNTLGDLNDCLENIWDECDDKEEDRARKRMIKLIRSYGKDFEENDFEG